MECHEVELKLNDYLEHQLSDEDRHEVSVHLAGCAGCSLLRSSLEHSLGWLRSTPVLEPPPRLLHRIFAETTRRPRPMTWREYLLQLLRPLYATPRFAAGACVAVISFTLVMNAFGVQVNQVNWRDFTPQGILQILNRTVNLAYDSGVRKLNDLKLLYEIQSRIDELRGQQDGREPEREKKDTPKQPKENSATEYLVGSLHMSELDRRCSSGGIHTQL
ncbi:MAG: zf-HC2 domain-containing protein [Acidobacteriota bacterium]